LYINEVVNKYHANSIENTLKSVWVEDASAPPEKYRQTTIIYDGLPLLVFAMDKINGLVKNTIHIVCDVNTKTGTFKLEDNDGEFIEADVNKKFIMCYAMTIHKSQGDTIDGQVNIHEYDLVKDDKRLYYTAVSRGRELEKIKYFN
jgi:ATP-dependent exoDNAse (exonuclease V) alpha subunit